MHKPFTCIVLLALLFSSCLNRKVSEQSDINYWKVEILDSAYSLLYKDGDTTRVLTYFDTRSQNLDLTIYPLAARFELLANYFYFFTSDNNKTAAMIDSSLALYDKFELQNEYPHSYVKLLLFGGQIAYRLNQYSKANEYYFTAKKIADSHLDACERTSFNYSIAMVLYRQQNFQASLKYFKEAYRLQENCSPQTTAIVLQQQEIQSNIGLCLIELKNYDSAMLHFNKALAIANQYKDSLGQATMEKIQGVIYGNKAMVLMAKNRFAEAEQLSLKSIALNDRDGYEKEYALGTKLRLAELYGLKKDFSGMYRMLGNLNSPEVTGNIKRWMEWNRLMASYYEQNNRPDSAIIYFKNYTSLGDSIDAEQRKLTAADVARQLRYKELQLEINLLKKQNELGRVWLWGTIIFSALALIIVFLIYQYYRRSKKSLALSLALNEEINQQKAAREEEAKERHKLITEAVIKAQEDERSLIGLELHDNINQVLTTVKLHNEMVLDGIADAKMVLPRSLTYLQDCINEIRSLSKRLSAPTLGKISLEESVNDLIQSINLTSKVKITQQISGFDNEKLHKDLHVGVYRILQEQLNNVLKHADASEVLVELERTENAIYLSVKDNGKGFVTQNRNAGIGLMNMQTRAENLNGSFALKSRPGKGCEVEVILPCN